MLSDVSSLTDLSSDEDYVYVSKSKKTTKKREWQPKQILKAPRLTQYSTTTLYEEILNGKVDLDPEYQRDVVWTDAKQSGLIDSILRNFYIPPVIFAFSQNEDGEERRTCIDGKQRLTSIQRFMDGQIPFKDSRTNLKLWYKRQPWNERGKLLPSQYKKQFDLKQISCVEYTDLNEDAEREIFQRVQLGVALTPAERMQAIAGLWPQLVREILSELDKYNISDALEWAKTRGRDFHSVATIIYLIEKGRSVSYPAVTALEKWLRRVTPPTREFKNHVMDVFTIFRHLVLTKKHSIVFQKPTRVSPIEFVMTVVLINVHHRNHTLAQLTEGIRQMRKDVRSKHDDIRANTKITKTMLGFIHDRWPTNLKKEPGEKALDECKVQPVQEPAKKAKRKRSKYSQPGDSESSEDERPLQTKVEPKTKMSPPLPSKPTPRPSVSANREPARAPTPKPEPSIRAKPEATPIPEPWSSAQPDRLDKVRRAKERIGLSAASQLHGPTPPPTTSTTPSSGQIAVPPQQPAQNFMNNPNQVPPSQMWPSQFNSMAMAAAQMMFQQPNMQSLGQGAMPPLSKPNIMSPTDSRANPFHSGPPTPNLHGMNGVWPSPNDPHQGNVSNYSQRSVSLPSVPGASGSSQSF
ncbi:hypothetical protein A7U60_g409 [Sanghuangporus baumii]|uniref:GmrSD restriction endonucleases N-terminal domain-containing protein n=1 Tax=Sanghuangporus baumii TaxID=108892 RepID=A0A9Q5I5T2_SANBA|nr:hypothetical protein A7U60_g409 [Sanghuangporus baumii]